MLSVSDLFNKFLFCEETFFSPYSVISPSIEFDLRTDVVSTVATPIRLQKYSAVFTSVAP